MSTQRAKGQEVSLAIVRDAVLEDTLVNIQDFEVTDMLEVISKGYLGEKTERKDNIYKGVKFKMTLHLHAQDWFPFRASVIATSQQATPDSSINLAGVLNFPNGDAPNFSINGAKLGELPMNVPARGDYVAVTVQGEAEEMAVTTS